MPAAALLHAVSAAIVAIVSTGIVWQSSDRLATLAKDADTVDLAEAIERGEKVDPTYLAGFVQSKGLDRPSSDCGDAITRARLTVTLAAFRNARQGDDVTRMDSAITEALENAQHRLVCNPLDGNAWLVYSQLKVAASGPDASALAALRLSYQDAPAEIWVVESRLPFATRLVLAGVSGFETDYAQDLRRFADAEPWWTIAKTYVETAPKIRALLHPLIAVQPEPRRKDIVAEIDRLGMLFDGR